MDELEKRVKLLEEIEAIKKMKHAYAYAIDERRWDDAVACFTDDAVTDFGSFGKYTSKKGLLKFLQEHLATHRQFTRHLFHNPIIEVNGNTAKGTWYFHIPAGEMGKSFWTGGKYNDEYVKVKGEWKHSKCICTGMYNVPYEKGFH